MGRMRGNGIGRGMALAVGLAVLAVGALERQGLPEWAGGLVETARASLEGAPAPAARSAPVSSAPRGDGSYDRDAYGGWIDEDGNCRDTRAEVLAAHSTVPVTMRKSGCAVAHGRWHDPYTGTIFTQASDLDIDHMVPLAWAHAHGAASWPPERKRAFANWQANLFPVKASVNREKGADGPLHWLPPRLEYRCEYILRFERIAAAWGLSFTPAEATGMAEIRSHWCPAR